MTTSYGYRPGEYNVPAILDSMLHEHERDWTYESSHAWNTEPGTDVVVVDEDTLYRRIEYRDTRVTYCLHQDVNGAVSIRLVDNGRVEVKGATASKQEFDRWVERVKEHYPEIEETDTTAEVCLTFNTPNGPKSWTKHIEVQPWEETCVNYPASIRKELEHTVSNPPSDGGRLLLWQGVPGTGKTHAIRSLMQAWKKRAKFLYVVDPESFFGNSPAYMIQTIMEASGSGTKYPDYQEENEKNLMVIVLEDSGELLAADARDKTGQGLSRLLNVVDGIIGQGLNLMLLITTNESIGSFHPAVTRPGRCVQAIEFEAFDTKEARSWLDAKGVTVRPPETATIAELYSIYHGWRSNNMDDDRSNNEVLYT